LGWDGKFQDLESVAFTPLLAPANMHQTEPELVGTLNSVPDYVSGFQAAFGPEGISRRTIELALATFQRTIVSGPAPFDRWIEGDEHAISDAAKRGFDLFNGRANCAACHTGWNFTEGAFYDIGLSGSEEAGRGYAFPKSVKLHRAFKVPTLRDVARRAPYMHNGSLADLDAVIGFYDTGGEDRPSRSDLIHPLGLTDAEKIELRAFLEALTSDPVPPR
jgi:cytochrome c peroxidase